MIKIFKKSSIALLVAGLVLAGGASAAIVSYISNAPTATVNISSPVDIGIYKGSYVETTPGTPSIEFGDVYAGSDLSFTTLTHNNANKKIGGYYVTVIESTDGDLLMTGEEITEMWFNKNKGSYVNQDITGALCVVKTDGTLTPLSTLEGWTTNKKLILFYDSDGFANIGIPKCYTPADGVERCEGDLCSALVPYIGDESRSVSHLDPGETEKWTFTPTWNTGTDGTFTISAQYVNTDKLAEYAIEQYGL